MDTRQVKGPTMTSQLSGETSGEQELLVPYPTPNGRSGRIFVTLLLGVLTVVFGWLPFLALNQLLILAGFGVIPSLGDPSTLENPSATWPLVAVLLVVLTPGPVVLGYFTLRAAVLGGRSGRGDWWLRLSRNGFEVNDQLRNHAATIGAKSTSSCSSRHQRTPRLPL
jgi:hypothetical protein